PNPGGAGEQVSAAGGHAGSWAVIASWYASVEEVNRQNERLGVAGPAASPGCPGRAWLSAVVDTTAEAAAVIAFPVAKATGIVARRRAAEEPAPVHGEVGSID